MWSEDGSLSEHGQRSGERQIRPLVMNAKPQYTNTRVESEQRRSLDWRR